MTIIGASMGIQLSAGADENFVCLDAGIIQRYVPKNPVDRRWAPTYEFMVSPLFKRLMDLELIPKHSLVQETDSHWVFEVERISPLIRHGEFIPSMVRDVVEASCLINKICCEFPGGKSIMLTEPHSWNWSFRRGHPVLLDVGAFDSLPERRQYSVECLRVAAREFFPHFKPSRVPSTVREWLDLPGSLGDPVVPQDRWDDYDVTHTDTEVECVRGWVSRSGAESVLDLGGGSGVFTRRVALGARRIVVDRNVRQLERGRRVDPGGMFARVDLGGSIPADAVSEFHLNAPWSQRFRSDFVVVSSVSHHVPTIFDIVKRIRPDFLAVELIGPSFKVDWISSFLSMKLVDYIVGYDPVERDRKWCFFVVP